MLTHAEGFFHQLILVLLLLFLWSDVYITFAFIFCLVFALVPWFCLRLIFLLLLYFILRFILRIVSWLIFWFVLWFVLRVILWLVFLLIFWLIFLLVFWLVFWLVFGLIFGLIFRLVFVLWLGGCNTFVFMFILLLQLRYFLGGIVFKFAFRNRNGLYFFFLNSFWLGFDELFLIDWSVLHQHFRFFINVFNDHVEPLCHFIHFKLVLLFVVFFIWRNGSFLIFARLVVFC